MNSLSLSELTGKIQQTINSEFNSPIWVRAEISEMRINNGHCYLELIEKEEAGDNITAKIRATIWANTFRMLQPYFESTTGETLRAGLNVLVLVVVEFNPVYGISLNVRDVDPVFTIGELAARRLEIIHRLEQEGIADMNKQHRMPTLPQRIAVISSESAAGYGDFCDQLSSSMQGYAFYPKLFPAIMQGMQAESSIIQALEKIYAHIDLFDVVVIIRGGGATTDLSCFDSYNLALNCAQFPLPIIAGIGHQRDVSILDRVTHTSVKTPTAAAEFLIFQLENEAENLDSLADDLYSIVVSRVQFEQKKMEIVKIKIRQAVKTGYLEENNRINNYLFRLKNIARNRINGEKNKLSLIQTKIDTHSPTFLLERGYTITTLNGKRLSSRMQVKQGDTIQTYLTDGSFESKVQKNT